MLCDVLYVDFVKSPSSAPNTHTHAHTHMNLSQMELISTHCSSEVAAFRRAGHVALYATVDGLHHHICKNPE